MEKFAYGFAQRIDCNGFAKDDIHGLWLRARDFDQSAKTGEHDDRDVLIELLDKAGRLIAAHLRHDAVENNEIKVIPAKFFQRLATTCRRSHNVSVTTQITGNYFKNAGFIVDNENLEGRPRFCCNGDYRN